MNEPMGVFLDGRMAALADFANLCSIRNDLWVVEELCDALAQCHPAVSRDLPDHLKPRAYWESAVITYGRCFGRSRGHFYPRHRRGIRDEVMAQLAETEREVHEWAMHERNEHVAHRIDLEGERMTVAAQFEGDDIKIVWSGERSVVAPVDRCRSLGQLARRLRGLVAEEAKRAEAEIIASLREAENLPQLRAAAGPLWDEAPPPPLHWGPYVEPDP